MESGRLYYTICLVAMVVTAQEPTYIAIFNMAGGNGSISFTPSGEFINIAVDMNLPTGLYDWTVRDRPTLYEQRPSCGPSFTGGVFTAAGDLGAAHGQLDASAGSEVSETFSNSQLKMTTSESIFGRSLVLSRSGASPLLICANIVDNADTTTATARFMWPFAGTVTFRQRSVPSDPAVTGILVDLYNVQSPPDDKVYKWEIHDSSYEGDDYNSLDLMERCSNTRTAVYDQYGNLTGKFGTITVRQTDTSETYYFIDTNLPVSQTNSAIGKMLVFTDDDGEFVACSPIVRLQPKTFTTKISISGVNGTLEFSQTSPYDATRIKVALSNLTGLAGGYHVHEIPIGGRTAETDMPASSANAGGHYNPFSVDFDSSPDPATATHDQYEVGDLSGKFGLLAGLDSITAEYVDWNLPLFGKYSIAGRSIVIHRTEQNERWAYGNILSAGPVKTFQATFNYVVVGKMVFRQDPGDPYSDTTVYVEVTHGNASADSYNHNFHVHDKAITDDYLRLEDRCQSAAAHYNPFVNALPADVYSSQCSVASPLRCEVGDLSNKLSPIDIPSAAGNSNKFFFTDPLLPLSGAYSITGRSIVIHIPERGAARYACANLYEVPTTEVALKGAWYGGPITGSISMSQDTEFDLTQLEMNLEGLQSQAGGYHFHVVPLDRVSADGPCSAASTQGHYNPFGIVGSPPTGTDDMYEVGDLSGAGRFGFLSGDEFLLSGKDSNLPLTGPRSVAGRPIVIHKNDEGGTRWVCADTDITQDEGDFTLTATVPISTRDDAYGTVVFSQTRFASGYLGDTRMEVNITIQLPNVTEANFWIFDRGFCSSPYVYNPYEINAVGRETCSVGRMNLCAMGDLPRKHGTVYSRKRVVFTDSNLPLFDLNSVVDQNLGVELRYSNGTALPLTCLDVVRPDSNVTPGSPSSWAIKYNFPSSTKFDAYEFRQTVAAAVADGNDWQVLVNQEPNDDGVVYCVSIYFYLIGTNPNLEDMVDAFYAAVAAGNLGPYNPTELCSTQPIEPTAGGGGGSGNNIVPSGLVFIATILCVVMDVF